MKRKVVSAWALALICGLCGPSCSPQPESSGTNTNWLKTCTSSEECAVAGSCVCGLCTAACSSDAGCSPGVCGSALATAFQCDSAQGPRLCLPNPPNAAVCSEFSIAADADLDVTPTAACDTPGALLCESFDAPLPAEDSTWYTGAMTAAITDCRVHQGAGAIHYQTQTFGYSQTRMRLAQSVSSGLLAARFYAFVPSQVTIPDYLGLFELWDQDTGSNGKISLEAKPNDVLEVYVTPNGTTHPSAAGALLRDQWMCLTLTLNLAGTEGSISVTVNGTPVIDHSAVVASLPDPVSVAVVEGLPSSDATGIDLTIDDLVVATQPLACP